MKNAGLSARERQFRYDPLFVPEVDTNGMLRYEMSEQQPQGRVLVQIPIVLDNEKARSAALAAVARIYPDNATELQAANVYALKVGTISVSVPGLDALGLGANIVNPTVSFFLPTSSFTLNISTPNMSAAQMLVAQLAHMRVDYNLSFTAKTVKQNVVTLKYTDLRKSTLFVKLNGLNTQAAYVHRDDLRNLTEGINTELDLSEIIEDASAFDADIFNKVMSIITTVVNSQAEQFDAEKWAATYNGDDLKPDEISKTLNKHFDFDQGSHSAKRSGSLDTGGKVGVLNIMSAEGKFGGSFSTDDLQTWLKQHGVETTFEGNKIVAKSIELQRINMATFAQQSQFTSRVSLVSSGLRQQTGNIDFAALLATGQTALPIPSVVAELSEKVKLLETSLQTQVATQAGQIAQLKGDLAARDLISHPSPDCLRVGETVICWLRPIITPHPQANVRLFNVDIPPVFGEIPTVVPSVRISNSSGFGFNIYTYSLSASNFRGTLAETA